MLRIGQGYDVHKLVEGRKLVIGGVEIEHEKGLLGHSDADVLLHAIADAILGACACGDIGCLFPDDDEKFKDANSIILLEDTIKFVNAKGFNLINIDSTIVAQRPKMKPHIENMRENIAKACNIDISCVSVKATTEERLGFTGEELGISAQAIVLVEERKN